MSIRYDALVLFCDPLNHCEDFIAGNSKDLLIIETWNLQAVINMNDPNY